jgi:hypothetical protein
VKLAGVSYLDVVAVEVEVGVEIDPPEATPLDAPQEHGGVHLEPLVPGGPP